MKIELTVLEARLIGCLIEKQITTPDQYPLSLNALANACNQKSNRDPVMDLDEATVQKTLDSLSKKHFVMEKSGFGSRVPKYQHRFCNTEFGTLKLDPQELAIVCELLVRGPQTPGELRTRASRMAPFAETSEVEAALTRLAERPDGPFVVRLVREPNRRDSRWAHLFSGPVADAAAGRESEEHAPGHTSEHGSLISHAESNAVSAPEISFPSSRNDERLAKLEQEVLALRAELDDLKRQLGG
ncbi:MAG TPA: DUF480 domain-containing protein [Steroidobacteraceae bacterium]|nr:DUF480 domain-containing protein [Steroidobacteraceae bacterium]